MQRRYGVKILLTAVVVLSVGYGGLRAFDNARLPFYVDFRDARTAVIRPIPGIPLPDDLRPGDQIDLATLSPSGRIATGLGSFRPTLPIGRTYEMTVRRNGAIVIIPVTSISVRTATDFAAKNLGGLFSTVAAGVVALLAFWWGRDRVAFGLGLWAAMNSMIFPVADVPADGMVALGLRLGWVVIIVLARAGFYVMAESMAGAALHRRVRLWWQAAFLVLLGLASIQMFGGLIAFVATGWAGAFRPQYLFALPGCYLLVVALLFVSYLRSEPAQRPRLRWMVVGGALYSVGILIADIELSKPQVETSLISVLGPTAGYVCVLYATLRHRVVDLKVVLNRAMVYAATTSLVLGLFALFESVVTRMALGKGASLALELTVPLALGASLSTVHRRVDGVIDRLVFRRQYQEDLALREFGKECAFVTQPDKLLDLTVDQVSRYTEAPWVALYEPGPAGYERVRQCGERALPPTLGVDDLAPVKLRTHGADLDLQGTDSSLGREGYAFPLRMRDKLMGVLVLGPRPNEHYSAEERELLAHVTHQVGAALFALRAEAAELRAEASELSLREARTHAQVTEARLREASERELASENRLREAREREQALLDALRNAGAAQST